MPNDQGKYELGFCNRKFFSIIEQSQTQGNIYCKSSNGNFVVLTVYQEICNLPELGLSGLRST